MSTLQTIEIDASEALQLIQTFLPILEQVGPLASVAGPVGVGVSAAIALLGLLNKIPSGLISDADQAALQARIAALQTTTPFSGPEWQVNNS